MVASFLSISSIIKFSNIHFMESAEYESSYIPIDFAVIMRRVKVN